jgi:hypothetical protein
MDPAPLVMSEIEAGEEFIKRLNAYQPVRAACWLRPTEDSERYLYVAPEGLTDENIDAGYNEVLRVAREMKDHYIDPFRVRLIRTDHPVARAVLDIYRRYPGRIPTAYTGSWSFGGMAVTEAWIYPQLC